MIDPFARKIEKLIGVKIKIKKIDSQGHF